MKTKFLIKYFCIVTMCTLVICFSLANQNNTTSATANLKSAFFQVYVVNKINNSAIDNATVCIMENRTYYQTDKTGRTEMINIALSPKWLDEEFYTFTLLIYKKGFNDYLYFNLKLKANSKRVDIVIPLVEIINEEDIETTIYYEPPISATINELILEYKK